METTAAPHHLLPSGANGAAARHQRRAAGSWRRAFNRWRVSQGVCVLAGLAALGLLLAFHAVMQFAVAQGDAWRQAQATHASAVHQCNGLPGLQARNLCRSGLARGNAGERLSPVRNLVTGRPLD